MGQRKSDRFATSVSSRQLLSRMFANGDNLLPNADPALNDVLSPIIMRASIFRNNLVQRSFDETL